MKPVAVIGASLAGMAAVESMRAEGYGGPIAVIDGSGVLPHDRPPLSKQVLVGDWDLERAERPVAGRLDDLDIELLLGSPAVELDLAERRVVLADGAEVVASAVVVATGSRARTLGAPLPPGSYTLRTGEDALALRAALDEDPARVVVVGAGFIGAEVAASCRARGLEVTMIEAASVPLERVLPGGTGAFVADLHRSSGVQVRLGSPLAGVVVDARGQTSGVELVGGERIDASVVVIGVGATPELEWLAESGLEILDRSSGGGIRCDPTLLAAPGVVAAGDVAAWPNPRYDGELMRVEHWENAIEQGTHAGRRVLAEVDPHRWADPPEFASVPWFWSDQYGAKIQMVGRAGTDDEPVVVEGSLRDERFVVLYRNGHRCTAALGLNRPRHVMQARMAMAESLAWDHVAGLF